MVNIVAFAFAVGSCLLLEAQDETTELTGLRVVDSARTLGKETGESVGDGIHIEKNTFTTTPKGETPPPMTSEFDASMSPKQIDLSYTQNGKQITVKQLFEVSHDSMPMCMADPGSPRPLGLESQTNTKQSSFVATRMQDPSPEEHAERDQRPRPQVALRTVYLAETIGRAHRISITGELGGKGQVTLDGNTCTLTLFGDSGICTEINFPPIDVEIVQLRIADEAGQGRRLFRLEGDLQPEDCQYYLVVPRRRSQSHRLIVDLGNDHRRVVTLEPVPVLKPEL